MILCPIYGFPDLDARKISSTNMLEQLNKKSQHRTKVVCIFSQPRFLFMFGNHILT